MKKGFYSYFWIILILEVRNDLCKVIFVLVGFIERIKDYIVFIMYLS